MKYISICSGIEAASVAWHPLGWEPLAFSEIEPFPCAVLAHHWPHVPNLGDMTKHENWPTDIRPDLIVGGTPCQAFSVAGLRKGLADPRGNLTLTFLAILAQYRPRWVVWENVPGVLSENTGAFGAFLGGLGELGYGFAYRVLDAQYYGVAQRRRRVFVVAHLGDWRPAAAVLFERDSLQGNPPPSREAGKGITHDVAPCLTSSGRGVERTGDTRGQDCVIPVHTTGAGFWKEGFGTLRAREQDSHENLVTVAARMVAFGEYACDETASTMKMRDHKDATDLVVVHGTQDPCSDEHVAFALGRNSGQENVVAMAYRFECPFCHHRYEAEHEICPCCLQLKPVATPAVAFKPGQSADARSIGAQEEVACTLEAGGGGNNRQAVAFAQNTRDEVREMPIVGALAAQPGMKQTSYIRQDFAVRRLTPTECERLQGFPDNWTAIPFRGKPAADGPRYKACGNSFAVPVIKWIGERIKQVEEMKNGKDT